MQVFKTYSKIAMRKMPSAAIYIVIFIVLAVIMAQMGGKETSSFENARLDVAVIDRDGTESSSLLGDYIAERHNIIDIDDNKNDITDAIYYDRIDYVLYIEEGYQQALENGLSGDSHSNILSNYKIPNSYTGTFLDNEIDKYINTTRAYIAGGDSVIEASQNAIDTLGVETKVEIVTENGTSSANVDTAGYYFRYLPYVFIMVIISVLSPMMLAFNEKNVGDRTKCSGIRPSSNTLQVALGNGLIVLATWLVFSAITAMLVRNIDIKFWYAELNSFIFVLIAALIGMLVSQFLKKKDSVSLLANIIGLGMSFLCGVFVPQSLLSEGVVATSRFLPAYWYTRANDMLFGLSGEAFTTSKFMTYLGVECIFAAALLAVVLAVGKMRNKAS